MKRILLLGKSGQLGWELNRTLLTLGELVCYDYPEVDFTRTQDLYDCVVSAKPDLIINAVAYTAVDRAESEMETCRLVNEVAPGMLAEAARQLRAGLIHYSTDYVFDGKKGSPYLESDAVNPLNVYGQTKLGGEKAVQAVGGACLVFRTSWVYSMRKGGFVTKLLQWAREQETLNLVSDQIGNPTWARMLAEISTQLIAQGSDDVYSYLQEKAGLYHLGGSGYTSRYEWGLEILRNDPEPSLQRVKHINPVNSDHFPTPAQRPTFTAMDCQRFVDTFSLQLPHWKTALQLGMQTD